MEPSGYRIEMKDKSVAIATDLGKYDQYTVDHLKGLNAIVLEANQYSKRYRFVVKGRIKKVFHAFFARASEDVV